jgi:hypothetical protein
VGLQVSTWRRHGSRHDTQDVSATVFGLVQSVLQDLKAQALDLDVHLASGDALLGSRDFKVHIAEVVFVAQDVAQYGVFA